jgi:hypothetical protein
MAAFVVKADIGVGPVEWLLWANSGRNNSAAVMASLSSERSLAWDFRDRCFGPGADETNGLIGVDRRHSRDFLTLAKPKSPNV